ncbi:MAG TPA: TadE/TadG family type IV pilus assembly protein [Pirellulales bacterium]|nr:TadE/TadG family type IV pilus assembly protein [Pirellulales bacterium]
MTSNPAHRSSCRRAARRGAVTVEFALVAPIFFMFVLGVVEFTRAMMVESLLTNAAHLGARAGIIDSAQTSDVTTAVTNYLSGAGISGTTISVTPSPPSSAGYGQNVTVKVSVPYSSVSWLPAPEYLKSVNLTATSIMRRETVQ